MSFLERSLPAVATLAAGLVLVPSVEAEDLHERELAATRARAMTAGAFILAMNDEREVPGFKISGNISEEPLFDSDGTASLGFSLQGSPESMRAFVEDVEKSVVSHFSTSTLLSDYCSFGVFPQLPKDNVNWSFIAKCSGGLEPLAGREVHKPELPEESEVEGSYDIPDYKALPGWNNWE